MGTAAPPRSLGPIGQYERFPDVVNDVKRRPAAKIYPCRGAASFCSPVDGRQHWCIGSSISRSTRTHELPWNGAEVQAPKPFDLLIRVVTNRASGLWKEELQQFSVIDLRLPFQP